MSILQQGPGFPLTRKGRGFSEILVLVAVLSLLFSVLGIDGVGFWELLELFKQSDVSVPIS